MTILTDDERRAAWDSAARSHQDDIARAVEAAVLAKLARQEPVGTVISYHTEEGHTKWTFQPSQSAWAIPRDDKAMERGARSCFVVFTHPAPQQADRQRVPAEPTEAMLIAARDWSLKKYGKAIGDDAAKGCFSAMLAAAPEAPAQASAVDERAIDAAARKISECMDYPWEHMPEKGRSNMREHAKAVLDAARNALAQECCKNTT